MKISDGVKQVVHPIKGQISSKRFDEISDSFQYQVDYVDADGNASHRWFAETEIELDADFVAAPVAEVDAEPATLETVDNEGGV